MPDKLPDDLIEDFRIFDQSYEQWLLKYPGRPRSEYNHRRGLNALKKGITHHTLGDNLIDPREWWEQGLEPFEKIVQQTGLPESARVCEIGCGSLRVGAHFIKRQDPGCYFGVDILGDFMKMGVPRIQDMRAEKRPRFGLVPRDIDALVAWQPDVVFTTAVALYIPPEEEEGHFGLLKSLAHARGAKVIFQAYLADESFRFARSGWARSFERYCQLMHPFTLTGTRNDGVWLSNGYEIGVSFLTYENKA